MGKPIVMGRKTYESIGRPLPGRQNIVITRQPGYAADGCTVVQSPEAAVEAAGDAPEIMIIGGSHIYETFLARADRIYLTRVHAEVDGDAFLPQLPEDQWTPRLVESQSADAANDYDTEFVILERVGQD